MSAYFKEIEVGANNVEVLQLKRFLIIFMLAYFFFVVVSILQVIFQDKDGDEEDSLFVRVIEILLVLLGDICSLGSVLYINLKSYKKQE